MAAVLGVSLALALLTGGSADASTTRSGCSYPYVCLYKTTGFKHSTGRFRDVTSGWQWLSRSRGATSFVNTRRDDVAYLLTTRGKVICVRPNTTGGMGPDGGGVKAIRISRSSHC